MRNDAPHSVLVVDDEPAILMLVEHQLSGLPFLVIPTPSGAEAIHILQSRSISVLISDLNMPLIDGHAVLTTARKADPNTVSIVLTGSTDQTQTIRAINEGGIWKFLIKPWEKEDLVGAVCEAAKLYASRTHQQRQLESLAQDVHTSLGPADTKRLAHGTLAEDGALEKSRMALSNNRYLLKSIIGQGGLGTVYLAEDRLLNLPVAIKVLKPSFTRDAHALATLRQEARIAMQLSHRHIVRIHNLQEDGGLHFLVMEYVPGHTLWTILQRYKKLPLDTVQQIVRVCADALGYAHRHKVIHRDLKPSNLLLDETGVLKVIDFGTAALKGAPEFFSDKIAGTPVYMSPEQVRGRPLDERTDVYAMGAITYELLTGNPVFPHATEDWESLAHARRVIQGLPDPITCVIEKAMAIDSQHRWASVDDFARALLEVDSGKGNLK